MTEEQFDEWKKDLWSKLCKYYSSINTSKSVAKKNVSKQSDSQLPLKISFDCSIKDTKTSEKTYEMAAR